MTARSVNAMLDFLSPISEVKGLGPKRVDALSENGIQTVGELLYYFPRRYIDRSRVSLIKQLESLIGSVCTVKVTVKRVRFEPGRKSRFRALVQDESGELELLWFQGAQYYKNIIKPEISLIVTGMVTKYNHLQMVHPFVEVFNNEEAVTQKAFVPQYSISSSMREAGIQQKVLSKSIEWVLKNLNHYPRVLPQKIEDNKKFPSLQECLREIHLPSSLESLHKFKARITYEELYKTALTLYVCKSKFKLPGRHLSAGELPLRFKKMLPFELTVDQSAAIDVLYADASKPSRMHRLLQGEVGSGKTLVAFFSCFPALNESLQVAWMAPTDVLARQSWLLISRWLHQLGIKAAYISGSTPLHEKKRIYQQIANGDISFVVGTHALLQAAIQFKKLGMVVIDEQHKFGVQQRLALQEKDPCCDFLLMSATPIPQSLAMTLYGELDILTIHKGPGGRLPVATHLVPEAKRSDMEKFIVDQIESHKAKVYYVVPRIESDEEDDSDQKNIVDYSDSLLRGVFANVSSGALHGKMKGEEKENVMEQFVTGSIDLLLSTTVIEVGIDVPDATIIVIENADRFGLAQLHQLRGRVGRGTKKSYCFLLTSKTADDDAINRLSNFCKNHDGFKIAKYDLQNRGPGELSGLRQSGWGDLVLSEILKAPELFREIQNEIEDIMHK